MHFATIEDALVEIQDGRMVIIVDDEDRENEGDLMGFQQLSRRWDSGQQLIQSQGVTYNVDNLPEGSEYHWPLDPIPLVIEAGEWALIEQAVIQRATLFDAVLSDLYGNQRLLHDGLVPSALVFANPHFLRACFGITPPGGVHLHTYAMLSEHVEERTLVSRIEDALRFKMGKEFVSSSHQLSLLLRNHFDKEDAVLGDVAEKCLSKEQDEAVALELVKLQPPAEAHPNFSRLEWKYTSKPLSAALTPQPKAARAYRSATR